MEINIKQKKRLVILLIVIFGKCNSPHLRKFSETTILFYWRFPSDSSDICCTVVQSSSVIYVQKNLVVGTIVRSTRNQWYEDPVHFVLIPVHSKSTYNLNININTSLNLLYIFLVIFYFFLLHFIYLFTGIIFKTWNINIKCGK